MRLIKTIGVNHIMEFNKSELDMSIIITYERYTLKVLSVTKVEEIINDTEVICGAMYKTLITNNNDAFYTDTNGNMYMNMNFTK